tara:strand:- start:678 stop:1010 length:333 start_codon:yes stop_codon:yes gene_type:complete
MTNYDHQAIRKAYPNVFMIDDDTDTIVDANGDAVTIDQSLVDTARAELDGLIYQQHRVLGVGVTSGYPLITDQLDLLYHDIADGKLGVAATTGSWYVGITSIKTNIPKPS